MFLFSLNLKVNKRLHFKMSQIVSNSVLGNKSLSILTVILIVLNISELTQGTPTELTTVLKTAQDLVQPQQSTWGLGVIGEMVSQSVEAVQGTIRYLIGIEAHPPPPREFYVVHIKDEKNPKNNRDVWRERGHEDKGDIPVNGGKLPDNSVIVNEHSPVTEDALSPQSPPSARQANSTSTPSTNAAPHEDIPPLVENKPQNENRSFKKNTNPNEDEDEENTADVSHIKESHSPAETQITSAENNKNIPTKGEPIIADHKFGSVIQPEDPKIAKSTNPQPQQDTNSNSSTSGDALQLTPAKKYDLPLFNKAQNIDTLKGSFPAPQQNKAGLQNFENQSSALGKEAHPQEYNNSSNSSSENHSTKANIAGNIAHDAAEDYIEHQPQDLPGEKIDGEYYPDHTAAEDSSSQEDHPHNFKSDGKTEKNRFKKKSKSTTNKNAPKEKAAIEFIV